MLFTLGEPMRTEQLAAVRRAMALYGGSVTSRLFLNVRERDHLCYCLLYTSCTARTLVFVR